MRQRKVIRRYDLTIYPLIPQRLVLYLGRICIVFSIGWSHEKFKIFLVLAWFSWSGKLNSFFTEMIFFQFLARELFFIKISWEMSVGQSPWKKLPVDSLSTVLKNRWINIRTNPWTISMNHLSLTRLFRSGSNRNLFHTNLQQTWILLKFLHSMFIVRFKDTVIQKHLTDLLSALMVRSPPAPQSVDKEFSWRLLLRSYV